MKTASDPMTDEKGRTLPNSPLHRIQQQIDAQPIDQESTEFYVGDVRDVCNLCDPKDKAAAAMRDKLKDRRPGELIKLPIADVRTVTASAH